jgi:purine-binding chemotaxis protein CheW
MDKAAPAIRRFLTFRVDQARYALPAEEVSEIIAMPQVARLPHSPQALLGMANLRGDVVAVASLQRLLGQGAEGPKAATGPGAPSCCRARHRSPWRSTRSMPW